MEPDWSGSKEIFLKEVSGQRTERWRGSSSPPLTEGKGLNETEPWLRMGGFREPTAGRDGEGSSWKTGPPGRAERP